MKFKLWIYLIIAPLLGITFVAVKVYHNVSIWHYQGEATEFKVTPGEGFASINYRLNKKKLISSAKIFHRYAQYHGHMTKIKPGIFTISPGDNMPEVFNKLINGKTNTIKITFPEGKNLFEIGAILENHHLVKKADFIKAAKDTAFVNSLGINADRIEGYLFPDTYFFTPGMKSRSIIKMMVNTFNNNIKKIDTLSTTLSKHQIVTLASIVEKETGAKFERPIIAGVFHNRLKKKMRLQSDPTTIYGIFENYNGNLKKSHLLQKTPYNTYKIKGLPRGPIANPGLASLKAITNPKQHQFYYFVSKNDGTHIFSKNYTDHKKAVKKWQVSRKNRKGKSWRNLKQ